MHFEKVFTVILAGSLVIGLAGCNQSNESQPPQASTEPTPAGDTGDDHATHDHADHEDHDHSGDSDSHATASGDSMEKMMAGLADLSPEDHKSAMQQHVCPVSGQMLGTMGAPEKVDVNGKQVWICCDGCKDKLLADPEKYLAKLEN